MRSLIALFALACLFGSAVRADDAPAPKYFLVDGKVTTESRVTELEKKVADLEQQLAALKGAKTAAAKPACVCGDDCACKAGECPGKCPVVASAPRPGDRGTVQDLSCYWVYFDPATKRFERCPDQTPPGARPAETPATITAKDGSVYELRADGHYWLAAPAVPQYAAPTYAAPVYAQPSYQSCPGGNCQAPQTYRLR